MINKRTKTQKLYYFIGFPTQVFIALYIIMYIASFFNGNMPREWWEMLSPTLGISIAYWLDRFYPSKPSKDQDKPQAGIRDTIKEYTVHGSGFNRLMVTIYSLIILMTVGAYIAYVIHK